MIKRLLFSALALALFAGFAHHGVPGGGGSPATLSSQSAIAVGWSDARGSVTTDTGSGTLFTTVQPTSIAGTPTAAQVKTCKNADGTTAAACTSQSVAASGAITKIKLGCTQATCLNSVTSYKIWFVQNTSGGDSNVVSAAFTTNGKITITAVDDDSSCALPNHWNNNPAVAQWNAVRSNVIAFATANYSSNTNITLKWTTGWGCSAGVTVSGGATSSYASDTGSYNTVVWPAFQAIPNKNSFQTSSFGVLASTDPTGVGDSYSFPFIQECATGIGSGVFCTGGSTNSGSSGFGSSTVWNTVANGTTSDGNLQLWQVMHHELTELMGRNSGINIGNMRMLDALSFSANAVHNVTTTGSRYPSVTNGASSTYGTGHGFNQTSGCNTFSNGDCGDLDGTVSSAFNASGSGSIIGNPPLQGDFQLMTEQGYGLSEAALTCAETGTCSAF